MKKIILSLLCAVLLLSLVACDELSFGGGGGAQNAPKEKSVWQLWSEHAESKRDRVTVEVTTEVEGVTLQAYYELKGKKLSYSMERARSFELTENPSLLPTSYKETVTGNARVENGKVTQIDGTDVSLPNDVVLRGGYTIKDVNLTNIKNEDGKLTADVLSAEDFFGYELEVSDLQLELTYTKKEIVSLRVSYKTAAAEVSMLYLFG